MNDPTTLTGLIFLGRALQFGSGILLVNVAVFRWLILPPAPLGAGGIGVARFYHRLDQLLLGSALALVVSGFVLFLGAAAGMSGTPLTELLDPALLSTVLRQTDFGHVSEVRATFALGLVATIAWLLFHRPSSRLATFAQRLMIAILATGLFLSVAWTGHAAAVQHPGLPWPLVADLVHLAAASVWPGGLLPFAIFLGHLKKTDSPDLHFIQRTARRFSAVSFVAVLTLALSGTLNAWFIVGTFSRLVASTYGHLLCLKLLVFLLMLSGAAWNRQVLLPRLLARAAELNLDAAQEAGQALRGLVLAEVALALVVIVIVSLLGITPPPGTGP